MRKKFSICYQFGNPFYTHTPVCLRRSCNPNHFTLDNNSFTIADFSLDTNPPLSPSQPLTIHIVSAENWQLKARRTDLEPDKVYLKSGGTAKEISQALQLLATKTAPGNSEKLEYQIQVYPSYNSGPKTLKIKLELYSSAGLLNTAEFTITYECSAFYKIEVVSQGPDNLRAAPGGPTASFQTTLKIWASGPWKLFLSVSSPGLTPGDLSEALSWQLGGGQWLQYQPGQLIFRGDPTGSEPTVTGL